MSANLVTVKSVTYQIGSAELLHTVSLSLRGGELVGLIGPNGAGKSTLLKTICGLRMKYIVAGEVYLCDKPLSSYSPRQIAHLIGQVQQGIGIDAPFSVQDVVAMGRNPHLSRFQVETAHDHQVIEDAMRRTDTLILAARSVNTLSGGERQRVLLARALAQEPSIMLLDEATSNLDIRHQIEIMELTQTLAHADGLGVLIAIHDLTLAARYCDRLLLMVEGSIIASGTPAEVLTPENLLAAYQVNAQPYRDPFTGDLKLSVEMVEMPRV